MKIKLLTVGRTSNKLFGEAIQAYVKRVSHYIPFEIKELPDVKSARSLGADRQKEMEGRMLLDNIDPSDHVILLDERGKMPTSREWATQLDKLMVNLQRTLVFVIGGPYGFSQDVYSRANSMLALSHMTLTHEMVRLFFVEQIYRAMTILRGEPYHHD